ncbi:MAG: ImmA/IrrE family metallo-endopeptidase [Bacteroidales bacterium]|nr:ImmA/IrrE family metallo-endopeptidase [Bacteroidales bacterium]
MARIAEHIIEDEAYSLREAFSLGSRLPVDLEGLLIKQGILTVFTQMSPEFSGMCLKYDNDTNFILVNSDIVLGRQNFTIAHELYHLFVQNGDEFKVHTCDVMNPQSPVERHANTFASYFLLPRDGVVEIMQRIDCTRKTVNAAHIIMMCDYFGVSYKAMLVRVNKILGLTRERFELLHAVQPIPTALDFSLNTEVFEKPQTKEKVIGDYSSKAQALYTSGLISKGHLIELLDAIKLGGNE